MGRILAIDYGQKRTGLAVSDSLRIVAGALATVETKSLYDFIAEYLGRESVDTIIVGEPRQTNGEPSENMKRITPFVNRLRKLYPTVKIVMYDERYTSVLAHQAMLQSGISRKARQDKALVDRIAATIILEDYMESLRMKGHITADNNK